MINHPCPRPINRSHHHREVKPCLRFRVGQYVIMLGDVCRRVGNQPRFLLINFKFRNFEKRSTDRMNRQKDLFETLYISRRRTRLVLRAGCSTTTLSAGTAIAGSDTASIGIASELGSDAGGVNKAAIVA